MKRCAWDGEEVHEEQGSHEDRKFFGMGKLALYFCSDECQAAYIKDREACDGIPLYYVTQRGQEGVILG